MSSLLIQCGTGEHPVKMLLIDHNVSPEMVHETIGTCFTSNGISIEYRPYYPNLITKDFEDYKIIALFSGKTPYLPGSQFSLNAIPYLKRFVTGGGFLILGYEVAGPEGFAVHDRYLFNVLLKELNVQIEITNNRVADIENGYPAGIFYRPYYHVNEKNPILSSNIPEKIIIDRSSALAVGTGVEIIASSFPTALQVFSDTWPLHSGDQRRYSLGEFPVIAIGKSGEGHVMVMSRYTFNSIGFTNETSGKPLLNQNELGNTEIFLNNLTGYIRTIATEENEIIFSKDSSDYRPLYANAPQPTFLFSNTLEEMLPPKIEKIKFGAELKFWNNYDTQNEEKFLNTINHPLLKRYLKEGIRAGWGYITSSNEHNEKLIEAIKEAGLNFLWGVGRPQFFIQHNPPVPGDKLQNLWDNVAQYLNGSSIKWFIGMDYADSRVKETGTIGAQGQILEIPSPLDWDYWEKEIVAPLKLCAEFSKKNPAVGGITIDLELYGLPPGVYNIYQNFGFENEAYRLFLSKVKDEIEENMYRDIEFVTIRERFHRLKEIGLLQLYYRILEETIAEYAEKTRNELLEINPELLFAFYQLNLPSNWFSRGIMKGFGSPRRPVILFSFETAAKANLERLRKDEIYLLHATALLLGMTEDYSGVIENSVENNYGYWLNRITWLVDKAPASFGIEIPLNKSQTQAIRDLKEANLNLDNKLGIK